MPRKNRQIPHTRFQFSTQIGKKRRFATKQQALDFIQKQNHNDVELTVYKDIDGGWYLTSKRT